MFCHKPWNNSAWQKNDKVELVAFQTTTTHTTLTVSSLKTHPLSSGGGTNMSGAVSTVGKILTANPTTPYRLVVISDGQIGDKAHTLKLASDLEAELGAADRNSTTRVCLIRALTSNSADPDTAALACLGQLNTGGITTPKDCPMIACSIEEADRMTSSIVASFLSGDDAPGGGVHRTVSCGGSPVLARLPGAQPQSSLQVPEGSSFVLLTPGAPVEQLSVDGEPIPSIDRAVLTSEEAILPLLLYLESQVRQLMVIGQADLRVKQLLDWVGRISHLTCQADDSTTAAAADSISPSIIERRNRLLRQVSQRTRTVSGRLRSLANIGAVSSLNSQRQAEFLRGVGKGNTGKALARRAAKVDSGDINQLVRTEVVALRRQVISSPIRENPKEDPVSFYGHDTLPGILNSLASTPEEDLDELDASDIMQFVGPLGFSYFSSYQNDAPDPWSCFRLDQIFIGDSTYINSADLWTSRIQSGQGASARLLAPGTQTQITGVIPVRHLSPEAFEVLSKHAPTLLNLHVAASLRGSLVCMPGDLPAMISTGAVNLASALAVRPSEACAVALYALLKDLDFMNKSKGLGIVARSFAEKDPRPFLAGDLFVASGLKPLAAILAGCTQPTPELARAILGYSLYIAAGRKYKDPSERKNALDSILSIDAKNDIHPGAPGTPDPENTQHLFCRSYDAAVLRKIGGLTPEHNAETITAVVVSAEALKRGGDQSPESFFATFKQVIDEASKYKLRVFGTSSDTETQDVTGALALQAILSPGQDSRITIEIADPQTPNRKYKFPDVSDSAQVAQFVGDETAKIYAERYRCALKAKRDLEEVERNKVLIGRLVGVETIEEFIAEIGKPLSSTLPPPIKDRSSPAYPKLLEMLMNPKDQVPQRLMKLWVLILGRDQDGGVVWCNGNALRENLYPYEQVFKAQGKEGEGLWSKLTEVKQKYGTHVYRISDIPNRHGHCRSLPSWWALGYSSPDTYKAADPVGFRDYVAKRTRAARKVSWMKKK